MMANLTIKKSIIDYARDKYYFHINDLKRYFTEKGIKFRGNSLKQQIYLYIKTFYFFSRFQRKKSNKDRKNNC